MTARTRPTSAGARRRATRTRQRPATLGVLSTAIALTLAACSGDTDSGPGNPDAEEVQVTIGLTYIPDVQFAPFYLAESEGYFADEGVQVDLRHHGGGEDLFGALDAGEEDLVVAGGAEMLQARSQGVDVLSIATIYQEYPVQIFVPQDSPAEEVGDLDGQQIGVPGPFGETWFGLLGYLDLADLTQQDVDIEHIGFTQYSALAEGHVDAVVGFVTSDGAAFDTGDLPVRTIGPAGELPLLGIGLGTTDQWHEEQGQTLSAINRAVDRAIEEIRADPQQAVEATIDHLPGTMSDSDRTVTERTAQVMAELYGTGPYGYQDEQGWDQMAQFMADFDLLDGDVSVAEAYTSRWLDTE